MSKKKFTTGTYILMALLILGGLMTLCAAVFLVFLTSSLWNRTSADVVLVSILAISPWFLALIGVIQRKTYGAIMAKIISILGMVIVICMLFFATNSFFTDYLEMTLAEESKPGLSFVLIVLNYLAFFVSPFLLFFFAHKEAKRLKNLK